jgi:NAD(P)-dependent dehydrogenase (short-subunit alcohol dehydrogenase family)
MTLTFASGSRSTSSRSASTPSSTTPGNARRRAASRSSSRERAVGLAPHAITVNDIAPTYVCSEMIAQHLACAYFLATTLPRIPLGRLAEPRGHCRRDATLLRAGQILYA